MTQKLTTAFCLALALPAISSAKQPNIIVVLADDQGYQDLGCYGSPLIKTPNIDAMAKNGVKFTDFYLSASTSSPSRAGLLTGKMNTRNGVPVVLWPNQAGMPQSQETIAQALKESGYLTACFGKWHLGDNKGHLPTDKGFDTYLGIPFSNDMWISSKHEYADNINFREGMTKEQADANKQLSITEQRKDIVRSKMRCLAPLLLDDKIVEYPCEQSTTTKRYFDAAIDFIAQEKDKPFFIYITPAMPHWPLSASEDFKGKSERGTYGDVIMEIDYNMGRIIKALKDNKLDKNTLVVYTSDNGPSLRHKEEGGTALPLRDGKFSLYDGGVRVPCIMQWVGTIPKNITSDAMISSLDFFATFTDMAGNKKSYDTDGNSQLALLKDPAKVANSSRDTYFYVKSAKIFGVRHGDWKYLNLNGKTPQLYNLREDISEKNNLAATMPEKVKELQDIIAKQ